MNTTDSAHESCSEESGAVCSVPEIGIRGIAYGVFRVTLVALRHPICFARGVRMLLAMARGCNKEAERLGTSARGPVPETILYIIAAKMWLSDEYEARKAGVTILERQRSLGALPFSCMSFLTSTYLKDRQFEQALPLARLIAAKETPVPSEWCCDALLRSLCGLKRYPEALAIAQWVTHLHPQSVCLSAWLKNLRWAEAASARRPAQG